MNEKKELTAVEVLKIMGEICVNDDSYCNQCPLAEVVCRHGGIEGLGHAEKVVEVCTKWHEEHQQKPIETEWVSVCRLYRVNEHGERSFLYEELITDCDEEKRTEELLADCCKEHRNGDYIATLEQICRVKK